jgi:hypothetical protein
MVYSLIVKKEIRRSFEHVNNQRWDDAAKGLTPNAYHWVAGDHALGGERHGKHQTLQHDIRIVPGARFVVRDVSDGSAGHLSMTRPALWADQARDFVAWLAEKP